MIKALGYTGIHQVKYFIRLLSGLPITTPSLGSMTLDYDDVDLAWCLLKNRSKWNNHSVVSKFEDEFAKWNNSRFAYAFMGGRVALSAIIYALGLKSGDEVILPGYTCVVVPNAFYFSDIKVVYSDIELDTYGLDVSLVEGKINKNTRAILIHHLYGIVCRDYDKLLDIAERNNLYIIEDCAQATGAEYKGVKVGNFGNAAFYSSEQSKVFNTVQGGIAVTNDEHIAKKIEEYYCKAPEPDEEWIEKQLYNVILNYYQFKHPKRWWRYDWANIKFGKYRMISTIKEEENSIMPSHYGRKMPVPIAKIGINQLMKIDNYNNQRRKSAKKWEAWCDKSGYTKPLVIDDSKPVFLRYPVIVEPEKKENLLWALKELKVKPGVWFISNIHPTNCNIEECPNGDKAVKQCINFPTLEE